MPIVRWGLSADFLMSPLAALTPIQPHLTVQYQLRDVTQLLHFLLLSSLLICCSDNLLFNDFYG